MLSKPLCALGAVSSETLLRATPQPAAFDVLRVFDPIGPLPQETFTGTEGDDTFDGTDENDTFDLSAGGRDGAAGRDGDDLFVMGDGFNPGDTILGGGNQSQGDILQLAGDYHNAMALNADTLQDIELMLLLGSASGGGSYNFVLDDGNVEAGRAMTVVLAGDNTPDTLTIDGSAELDGDLFLQSSANGDDVLVGGAGNDCVDGGLGGADTLDGGGGTNRVTFNNALSSVTVSLALQGAAQDVGGGRMVTLSNIQDLEGSSGDDVLAGDGADNWLATRGGNDTMQGGGGDDFLQLDNLGAATAVSADGGGGNDTLTFFTSVNGVTLSLAVAGAQDVDGTLFVTAEKFENLGGSPFADTLTGDDDGNTLYGDAGDDTLFGGAGDDTLLGDRTVQPIQVNGAGRSGYDVFVSEYANDVLYGGEGNDVLDASGGIDVLYGGQGVDLLLGRSNTDTFVFEDVSDSGVGEGNRDRMDFRAGRDTIDLQQIDADSTMGGDQAFFLGGGEFTGAAGELIQFDGGGFTVIGGDVDGDGTADFELQLGKLVTVVVDDLVL